MIWEIHNTQLYVDLYLHPGVIVLIENNHSLNSTNNITAQETSPKPGE